MVVLQCSSEIFSLYYCKAHLGAELPPQLLLQPLQLPPPKLLAAVDNSPNPTGDDCAQMELNLILLDGDGDDDVDADVDNLKTCCCCC